MLHRRINIVAEMSCFIVNILGALRSLDHKGLQYCNYRSVLLTRFVPMLE